MPSNLATYWDAVCFIDRMQRRADRIAMLEEVTNHAEAGNLIIVTSTVAIVEVIKLPEIGASTDEQVQQIADYFEHEWISLRTVTATIAREAAKIRREHGLKTADAIHVATALRSGVAMMHTYDEQVLAKDGRIGKPPLPIKTPRLVGAGDLFSES